MVQIRAAVEQDAARIRQMVRDEQLDPTSLDWRHFLVAEQDGQIVGIGQIKEYPGCQELGSLVVLREYRDQGIAGQLITALESKAGRPLYLLCRERMEPYYQRFGYQTISFWQAPAVLKLKLIPALLLRVFGIRVLVMEKST
jgi:amino-acid N-acetyltransferase